MRRIAALYDELHSMEAVRVGFFHIGADVLSHRLIEWAANVTGGVPLGPALEIGCGVGASTRLLAQHFEGPVVGLDLTPLSLTLASCHPTDVGLASRLRWVRANAEDLPFRDNSISLVWSEEVFCHIPNRTRLLNECQRVLCPGGVLVFEDWAMAEGTEAERGLRAFHQAWRLAPMETMVSYYRKLQSAGFIVLQVQEAGLEMLTHWEHWHQAHGGATFEGYLARLAQDRQQVISVVGRRRYLEARQQIMIGRYIRKGWLQIRLFLAKKSGEARQPS